MIHISIIGNGIIGLQTAYALCQLRSSAISISIIGPKANHNAASRAAIAMLNHYAELTEQSLTDKQQHALFQLSTLAQNAWQRYTAQQQTSILRYGTYVLLPANSETSLAYSFSAILKQLQYDTAPHEEVSVNDIPGYQPAPELKAKQALFLPHEAWGDARAIMQQLTGYLQEQARVQFIDDTVQTLIPSANRISQLQLSLGDIINSDYVILTPGASFTSLIRRSALTCQLPEIIYGHGSTLILKTDKAFTHCLRLPNDAKLQSLYAAPLSAQHLMIGATQHISEQAEISPEQLTHDQHYLRQQAAQFFNQHLAHAELVTRFHGARPISCDHKPLIGPCHTYNNLAIACGTHRIGFHLAPIIAEYLAHICVNQSYINDTLFQQFAPERISTFQST